MKPWRLPKIKGSILKYRVPPIWPTYTSERRTTFAKAYGIKARCYGEHVGKYIENFVNILLNRLGNLKGTQWEPGKNEKILPSQTKLKKKKEALECMLGPSHWLHEISLPKEFIIIFWAGLIPPCKEHPTYTI